MAKQLRGWTYRGRRRRGVFDARPLPMSPTFRVAHTDPGRPLLYLTPAGGWSTDKQLAEPPFQTEAAAVERRNALPSPECRNLRIEAEA